MAESGWGKPAGCGHDPDRPELPLLPSRKRATRNNADTTAQHARDRAKRIVDAVIDRTRRMATCAAEAEAKAPANKRK